MSVGEMNHQVFEQRQSLIALAVAAGVELPQEEGEEYDAIAELDAQIINEFNTAMAVVNSKLDAQIEINDFMPFFNQKDEENEDDGIANYLAKR